MCFLVRKGEQGREGDLWVSFHLRRRCTEVRGVPGGARETDIRECPELPFTSCAM